MKIQKLTQAIAIVTTTTLSTLSFAAVEDAGNTVANAGDAVFTKLTGKQVYAKVNHPVSLYDYAEGNSSYEEAYINGRLNAAANPNKAEVKDSNDVVIGAVDQQPSFDIKLDTNYKNVISTLDSTLSYGAKADVQVSRGSTEGAETQDNWTASADVNYDKYFTDNMNGAFWYGKGDVKLQQGNDDYAGFSNPEVNATGGIGYGRVVNVTPMARAIRIVESLIERKLLSGTPSKAVYTKIATIASKEAEYKSKYGSSDYAQFWVKDIAQALGTNIGAAGTIKVYEVLTQEKISTRKYGWDVRAGLGAQLASFDGVNNDISPLLEAEANYYYPLDLKTQFSNETRLKTVLNSDNNSYTVDNAMGLTYQLSDRVDWANKWNLSYANNENADNMTTNELSTSYIYKISNALDFDTTIKMSHASEGDNSGKVDKSLTTGIKYRLK